MTAFVTIFRAVKCMVRCDWWVRQVLMFTLLLKVAKTGGVTWNSREVIAITVLLM